MAVKHFYPLIMYFPQNYETAKEQFSGFLRFCRNMFGINVFTFFKRRHRKHCNDADT